MYWKSFKSATMKTLSKILIVPLFAFLLLSCSSSDDPVSSPDGPDYSISELQGTWNATSIRFSYCGIGEVEPSSYEVIAEGGTATMVVQANGRFALTINLAGEPEPILIGGTMFFEDGVWFAIQFDDDEPDDPTYFGDTLAGNTFSLNGGPETAEWDFDGDGNDECASVDLSFVRV